MGHIKCDGFAAACLTLTAALICGCSDGLSDYQRDIKKMEAGQARIVAQGGTAELRQTRAGDSWSVNLSGATLTDETFEDLNTLNRVSTLDLSNTNFNDSMIAKINDTKIRGVLFDLNLSGTQVSDQGLEGFTEIFMLTSLDVSNTNVTKEGAKSLDKRWPRLRVKNDK